MRLLARLLAVLVLLTAAAPVLAQAPPAPPKADQAEAGGGIAMNTPGAAIGRSIRDSVRERAQDVRADVPGEQRHETRDAIREAVRSGMRMLVPGLVALGALGVCGLYFGSVWAMDRSDRGSGLLVLLSLAAGAQLIGAMVTGALGEPGQADILWAAIVAGASAVFAVVLAAFAADRFAPANRRNVTLVAAGLVLVANLLVPDADRKAIAGIVLAILVAGGLALYGLRRDRLGAGALLVGLAGVGAALLLRPGVFNQAYLAGLAALMGVLIVLQLITLRRRALEAEALRTRAQRLELELLKRHLTPHVLLNTLTSLTEWIAQEPKTGARMVDALAEELRMLSAVSDKPLITVGEELALCRAHLSLMSLKRDQPLSLETEGLDETAMIPPAIFHTLIENALTHNRYPKGARFRLSRNEAGAYVMTAPPGEDREVAGQGHGRDYIEARLAEVFGSNWRFFDGRTREGGWITTIEAPA